jgi:CRP/FNR family transcriptional regulator, cyclic AMP receptor protein
LPPCGEFDGDVSIHPSGPAQGFWDLLSPQERLVLRALALDKEHVYRPGTALSVEGDPATHVFVLLEGWVKILSVTEDGHQSILALRRAGDIVGETAGETTGHRNATMQAMVTVRALRVEYPAFTTFLDAHQGASRAYRHVITHRFRESDAMLRRHAAASGAQRLAGLLLVLAGAPAGQAREVIEIVLPLSQEDLASLAGASRATVTRALADWRKRGLVQTGQRHVTLTDVPGLRKVAGPALPPP